MTTVAGELRQAFDRTFAEPPLAALDPEEDVLAVTIGGAPFALRLSEIRGLHSGRTITWLPGAIPELLGLVGLRGALLPVYDLHALLGYPPASAPRWLAVADTRVGLAFEQFDRHLRVPRHAITPAGAQGPAERSLPLRGVVEFEHLVRPIIHVPSVLDTIALRVHQATSPKEQ